MIKGILILITLVTLSTRIFSQSTPFAQISVSRRSMYMQEPFRVTITVMTPTWFTAPPQFSNLQIPNAFILPFDQTVPGMFTIGKKQYAGIQFYYIVFPYKSGHFTVPPFPIQVTGPPEGSSVSRPWNLRTREIPFSVKEVPAEADAGYWLVAKNIFVTERWNKPLTHLKVGDVLERTDQIDARGTLPQFIPPIPLDTIDWASEYPRDPMLRDQRNDQDANGSRTQKTVYLIEKEGEFMIPEMTVRWWNPQLEKMFSKQTPAHTIHVAPNENLGILKTLKDSLGSHTSNTVSVSAGPRKIGGLPWYVFYMYVLDGLLSLFVLVITLLCVFRYFKMKMAIYKISESYLFRRFLKSKDDPASVINQLYHWWDNRKTNRTIASIQNEVTDTSFLQEWSAMEKNFYSNDPVAINTAVLKKQATKFRKEMKTGEIQNPLNIMQQEWPLDAYP